MYRPEMFIQPIKMEFPYLSVQLGQGNPSQYESRGLEEGAAKGCGVRERDRVCPTGMAWAWGALRNRCGPGRPEALSFLETGMNPTLTKHYRNSLLLDKNRLLFFFSFPPFSCDPTLISLLRGEAKEGVPCSPHLSPLPAVLGPAAARAGKACLPLQRRCSPAGGAVQITPSRLHHLTLTHRLCPLLTCKVISWAHPLRLAGWGRGRRAASQAAVSAPHS